MIEQSQQSSVETSILSITPAASEKVRELLKQENDPSLGLRIFVAGGGCSGLQYGMTLDEEQEGDTIISIEDFKVFVDDRSEEHTSELQSQSNLVCRLLLEKKKKDGY